MNKEKIKLVIDISLLAIFMSIIVYISFRYGKTIASVVSSPDKFRNMLIYYGPSGILIFIAFQILQVVVAAIPGEVVQIAGGYMYGTICGTIYSIIGIMIGALIAFGVARVLGFSIVKILVPAKYVERFDFLLNSKRSELAIFLLFLIPGLPKDVLTYIAGFTPIKTIRFFIISSIARLPGIVITSFIGANLYKQQYKLVIIAAIVGVVLFVIGLIYKDRLTELVKNN